MQIKSATRYHFTPIAVLSLVIKACPTLRPHGLEPTRLLCPWNFPSKNTGVGCQTPLQGICPMQGLNPRLLPLLHCRSSFFTAELDKRAPYWPTTTRNNPTRHTYSGYLVLSPSPLKYSYHLPIKTPSQANYYLSKSEMLYKRGNHQIWRLPRVSLQNLADVVPLLPTLFPLQNN